MPFRDKYTNFWFADTSSESMKVWMTNNKDLSFLATPNFNDAFVSPVASQTRYHTNTTINSSDITVKCLAIGVDMLEWRAIQQWLSPLKTGKLQFDFNDNTYYEAKIKSAIKGNVFVCGDSNSVLQDIYNIEFTITFTTVSDWAALGPMVTADISVKNTDFDLTQLKLQYNIPITAAPLENRIIYLTCTNTVFFNNAEKWKDPVFWEENIDWEKTETDTAFGQGSISGNSEFFIPILLANIPIESMNLLTNNINNKYFMPMVYNKTKNRSFEKSTRGDEYKKVFLTEPTILHNTTIYLDQEKYNNLRKASPTRFSGVTYFLLDNEIEPIDQLTDDINYSTLQSNYIGYIKEVVNDQAENEADKAHMILHQRLGTDDYDLGSDTIIDNNGISLYGLSVMFVTNSDAAYENCPFYYLEERMNCAVMNCSAYDTYPNIYLNLNRFTSAAIKKNEKLQYKYNLSIQNAALEFDGKTGFAIFNNTLAESASLKGTTYSTKIVTDSINNGILNIPSGNPELLKIRIFGMGETKYADLSDDGSSNGQVVPSAIHVKHIYFQPVGEFKYSRNEPFAALMFKKVIKEQSYDSGSYPLVNKEYLSSSYYGSRLLDYIFTVNGFISKVKVSNKINMWVLTLPDKDCTLFTPDFIKNDDKPLYMYLSLCDYTELGIDTDPTAASFLSMQTRDAY